MGSTVLMERTMLWLNTFFAPWLKDEYYGPYLHNHKVAFDGFNNPIKRLRLV